MKGPNPFLLAKQAENRRSGSRHARRAAEAEARKEMQGKSIPELKKLLRRKK